MSETKRSKIETRIRNIQDNKEWYISLAELSIYNEVRDLITNLINEFANDESSSISKYKENKTASVCLSGTAKTTKKEKTYSDISFNIVFKKVNYDDIMNDLDTLDDDDIREQIQELVEN